MKSVINWNPVSQYYHFSVVDQTNAAVVSKRDDLWNLNLNGIHWKYILEQLWAHFPHPLQQTYSSLLMGNNLMHFRHSGFLHLPTYKFFQGPNNMGKKINWIILIIAENIGSVQVILIFIHLIYTLYKYPFHSNYFHVNYYWPNNIQRNQVNTVHRLRQVYHLIRVSNLIQLDLHHSQQVMSEGWHHFLRFKHKLARWWRGRSSARSSDKQSSADPWFDVLTYQWIKWCQVLGFANTNSAMT